MRQEVYGVCASLGIVFSTQEGLKKEMPCWSIINQSVTFCLITYPIVCHVAICVCIQDKILKTFECVQKCGILNQGHGRISQEQM